MNIQNAAKSYLNEISTTTYDHNTYSGSLSELFKEIAQTIVDPAPFVWKVNDPMGENIVFNGFIGSENTLVEGISNTTGAAVLEYDSTEGAITWLLLHDEPVTEGGDSSITYAYTATYRVTIDNTGEGFNFWTGSEASGASPSFAHVTNGPTTLTYTLEKITDIEDEKNLKTATFDIPTVHAYAAPFAFTKRVAETTTPLAGASFALYLDVDEIGADTAPYRTATSEAYTGSVDFGALPSGHTYILKETSAPTGYEASDAEIKIKVAFGVPTFARVVRDEGEPPETTLDDIDDVGAALANVANSNNIVAEPTETAPPPSGPVYVYTPTPTSSTPTSPPPTDDAGSAAPTEAPTEAPAPVSPPAAGPATEPAAEPQPSPEVIPDLPPALGQLVPQEDGSYLELDEDGVPLGAWRYDPETDEWIFDEFPPLGDFEPPPTDDELTSGSPALLLLLASVLAAAFMVSRARRARRGR
jgi:hypothetical protein